MMNKGKMPPPSLAVMIQTKPKKPEPPRTEPNHAEMGDQDEEMQEPSGAIPAHAVAYHSENERCDACEFYGGGNCTKLKQKVDAGGHCTLFESVEVNEMENRGDARWPATKEEAEAS